jgi:2-polyprenyl-3-methyl-5-hydroxy-6-metoxy-1,4-benzoquinol methylase
MRRVTIGGMTKSNDPGQESAEIWNRIAGWWDDQIGEGNDFQRELIMPATDRLLAIKPGETVLDIACGNGNYSRRLARQGARVVACDVSENFIQRARSRDNPGNEPIEYHRVDATDEGQLLSLGYGCRQFDAAVCSMAMMDLATIAPLLRAVRELLTPAGRFVFSISHPCFNNVSSIMTAELTNNQGQLTQTYGVSVSRYLEPVIERDTGIVNQPELHYTFHRPLSMLLNECFDARFVVDGFEEPAYRPPGNGNSFSWKRRPQLPPAVVTRLRKRD